MKACARKKGEQNPLTLAEGNLRTVNLTNIPFSEDVFLFPSDVSSTKHLKYKQIKKTTIAFCLLHGVCDTTPGNTQDAAFMADKQIFFFFEDGFQKFEVSW